MDPIFDRLGRLFKSWASDATAASVTRDRDQIAAEEELEAFLRGDTRPRNEHQGAKSFRHEHPVRPKSDPKIVAAYKVLELVDGDPWVKIEKAHKDLLRIHHPDRHSNDPQAYRKATATAQRINEAYQILKKHWESQ